ncbi:MAG: acyl-CoA synthetase [Xanthobacteraceae bacterium]|nr:MAG: acyl-CoA synthetase [Xanthobacteraceae bacterium]
MPDAHALGPRLAADGSVIPAPMTRRVMNLADLLHGTARRLPDRPGLVWRDTIWSWREMADRVKAAAAALTARGIRKGDRVLCQSRNGNAMFEAMFAAWTIGAIWVPTNFRNTPQEVAYIARAARAKAMICESIFAGHAAAVKESDPDLALTISIGDADFAAVEWEGLVAEGRAHGAACPVAAVDYDDPC